MKKSWSEAPAARVSPKKLVRIHIGEYYASSSPKIIYTLLGSCVTVCLHDPVAKIGGMNHILIPGQPDLKRFDASARYGINAMELLINRIMNLGGDRRRITGKIFGGAHVLSSIPHGYSMGPKNIEFVIEFMARESIPIISRDVGGTQSRKIFFHTDSGDVYMKRGKPADLTHLANLEKLFKQYAKKKAETEGSVTLF